MTDRSTSALLRARPHAPAQEPLAAGTHPLAPEGTRRGLLVVPSACDADRPSGLAVLLHGAGGDAAGMAALFAPLIRALPDTVWVFPESRRATWDVIVDDFGPDVAGLDAALASVLARCAIDPGRIVVGGFSDGASYALTLGLANGGLFSAVLAFSPGFDAAPARHGRPRVFVSHGEADGVLPVDRTSRRIVPRLLREGYDVTYLEFDGAHAVPEEIQGRAARWLGWGKPQAQPAAP